MFILVILAGCDSTGAEFRPQVTDVPAVVDLGELPVVSADDYNGGDWDPTAAEGVHYGQLGASENPGATGGATYQFRGTGGDVCVVADPEAVFWNRSVAVEESPGRYKYEDHYEDDGDVDVSVGLTAYYTGSPGVEIGDFEAQYTDPSGYDHEIEFNECIQVGYFSQTGVHAGRATAEYCTIHTDQHEGIPYTVLLKTFSLPHDDSILNYGTAVFEGSCDQIGVTECTLPNEVQNADPDGSIPDSKVWFPDLEQSFCTGVGALNRACQDGFDSVANGDLSTAPCVDPDPSDNTTDQGGDTEG
jgi:hypothetical protein